MNRRLPRWLSAQEIADLALEGLPTSRYRVTQRADKERWSFKDRPKKDGGRLYAVTSLPIDARADLIARHQATAASEQAQPRNPVGRPRGSGSFFTRNPDIERAVMGWLAQRTLSSATIMELIQANFAKAPSGRTLRRHIAKLKRDNAVVLDSIHNPARHKSVNRLALGRADAALTYASERWEIDTTPGDVILKEGRKSILGIIDVYSRRVRFLVADSESAQSVRRLLAGTMLAWGAMPSILATDQGSGYVNQAIRSALELLDIEHKDCPPGSPEKKPFIERVFGTFQRSRAEVLAGYCGHDVAEAQRLRDKARKETGKPLIVPEMTVAELQAVLDNWADGTYYQSRHSSLGMSPMQKYQASPPQARSAPNADELHIVLSAYVGIRTVGKRGIEWKKGRYWSPALAPFIGHQVMVRRDEDELGELMIFDDTGRFIDVAINHERAGVSEEDFARAARAKQRQYEKQARAPWLAARREFRIEDAREALLRHDAELAGKLVSLPPRLQDQPSETIRSIRDNPASPQQPAPAPKPAAAAPRGPMAGWTGEQKVAEADAIKAAQARGEDIDPKRIAWADDYIERGGYAAVKFAQLGSEQTDNPDNRNPYHAVRQRR